MKDVIRFWQVRMSENMDQTVNWDAVRRNNPLLAHELQEGRGPTGLSRRVLVSDVVTYCCSLTPSTYVDTLDYQFEFPDHVTSAENWDEMRERWYDLETELAADCRDGGYYDLRDIFSLRDGELTVLDGLAAELSSEIAREEGASDDDFHRCAWEETFGHAAGNHLV